MKSEHIYRPYTTNPYPPSLTANDYWSVMTLAWSDEKQKFSKTPIDLRTGLVANSDAMSVTFTTAAQSLTANKVLSYRHAAGSPMFLGLIDCDHCVAPNGSISRRVLQLLMYMDTYAEYSVTHGIHVLCWLQVAPPDGHKDREWDMEFYWQGRSIPITGKRVVLPDWESPADLQTRTERFLALHKSRFAQAWMPPAPPTPQEGTNTLSPEEILTKLFSEPAGRKWAEVYAGHWQGYYESPSDADLALLIKFAFYTRKDRAMMEVLFSESPLAAILVRGTVERPTRWRRPKWANPKYRNGSLDEAIERTTATYTPRSKANSDLDLYMMRRQQIHEQRKTK